MHRSREVIFSHLQVMLLCDPGRMSDPGTDNVGGKPLGPLRFAGRPEVRPQLWPTSEASVDHLLTSMRVRWYLRSDNGSEFTATKVREWLSRVGVKALFIEPGSPWENGDVESFNGKLRDELLAREQFDTLLEAKVLIERWRRHDNAVRPHSSLGDRAPAPEAVQPAPLASATPQRAEQVGVGIDPTLT